jgi:WD40 repeat protein
MLRGHSDDVSRFVVSEGMVVSGGRDRSICGWSARTGKFLFARYKREGGWWLAEGVTALSVAGMRAPGSSSLPGIVERGGGMVVSGGRDRSMCGWSARTGKFLFARYNIDCGWYRFTLACVRATGSSFFARYSREWGQGA